MKKAILFVVPILSLAYAHADYSPGPFVLLYTTNTWMAAQLGIGQYPNWLIDGNFIGPNQPGVYTIKFKSLLINGDLTILNSYTIADQ